MHIHVPSIPGPYFNGLVDNSRLLCFSQEERFSEAQDFQDGGSSINDGESDYMQSGYMQSRSEASQDTPVFPSDGHNHEPSYFQEPPRSPMVCSSTCVSSPCTFPHHAGWRALQTRSAAGTQRRPLRSRLPSAKRQGRLAPHQAMLTLCG